MKSKIFQNVKMIGLALFSFGLVTSGHAQTLSLNGVATTCTSATITSIAAGANIVTQPSDCLTPKAVGTNPQLTSVSPACVEPGATVTANGVNLGNATLVTINSNSVTIVANTATSAAAPVPLGTPTGSATLQVTTAAGVSNAITFTIGNCTVAPTISSVTPTTAAVGATVTITGTNLSSPTSVTVNGVAATPLSGGTATTLSINVPSGASGTGSIVVTTAAGSASIGFTVQVPQSGGFTSIEGTAIPEPSKRPNVAPAPRAGQFNGAGPDMNAYAIDHVSRCSSATPAVTRLWAHAIDLNEYATGSTDFIAMTAGQALTYKFTTGASGGNRIVYNETTLADFAPSLMSISTSPCDFDAAKAQAGDLCYRASDLYNAVPYGIVATGNAAYPRCTLRPNTTYYFNIRFVRATSGAATDSCLSPARGVCGGVLQFQ